MHLTRHAPAQGKRGGAALGSRIRERSAIGHTRKHIDWASFLVPMRSFSSVKLEWPTTPLGAPPDYGG